jgi:hypothetical protein
MGFMCRIGRHAWRYIKGSETHVAWKEECKHCGKIVNRSAFDGW